MQIESHQSIWFFWLLPVIVVFFIFFQRRRSLLMSHFMPLQKVSERVPQYAFLGPYLRVLFFLLTVFFMLVAALKPYSGVEMREIKRKGVDLYLLVDLSESMLAEDIKPSRLVRARMEIQDFMAKAKGDRVGLIGFAGDSFVFVPLTTDREALSLFINELSADDIPFQGTDIKGAIEKAVMSFKTQSQVSSKAIILMTDGEDSIGLDDSVLDDIKKLGIKVFVIGIGTAEGAPIPQTGGGYKNDDQGQMVLTRLNEAALQELAVTTGGGYVRSVSGDLDLEEIYQRGIKKNFANADFSSEQKKVPHYRFQFFLFLAVIFLVLEMLTTHRKKYWRLFFRFKKSTIVILFSLSLFWIHQASAKNPYSFEKGNAWYQKGDYPSALRQYEDLAKTHPDDAEVSYNLGDTYYQLQQYDKARTEFKKSLNADDEQIRKQALYNLGNTEFRAKDYLAALDAYDKALKIDPHYTKAKLNYDFVKKMLEEQKKNQEQKQDQNSDQSKKQDEKNDSDEQKKDQPDQKQEKQKEDPKQKESDAGKKESDSQKDGKQDGDPESEKDDQKPDDKESDPESQVKPGQSAQKRPFDEKAAQWLDSLNDDPSQALKYMIQKQQTGRKKTKKDW
jgi:Ca-activated chloride channel family protein